jgi:DNA replication and repair protein RecF
MRFTHLVLKNFRCFKERTFAFSPALNTLYGENAQGKTTVIEALNLLITGRSFRTHALQELIRFGESYFYIEGHFEKNGVCQTLKIYYSPEKKTLWHNKTTLTSFSSLFGILYGITLAPEDLLIIKGGPKLRRQLLDIQSAQSSPLYLYHLRRYQGSMKQRNSLLRSRSTKGIEIWEEQMALSASFLKQERTRLVGQLNEELAQSPFEPQTLQYIQGFTDPYLGCLAKSREKDFIFRSTSYGPHKDDVTLSIDGKEAKLFASEGQKRSAVAALKIAGWHVLARETGSHPLLLIDDLGVSFDKGRVEKLIRYLENGFGQLFVTTAQPTTSLLSQSAALEVESDSTVTSSQSLPPTS